ncbi:Nitrous oxide reductase maturation protein NosD [Paramagnetospirillum magnetotacticum MS-1]|uniref:Nitrous oxide reductase maturation protein NosD n=1 Tax=Paramagnetospirillum magnetotacticum MS-1 TaxID=272627 RepID=A0A0C2YK06_PARME|nr:nitrous oxide reductase family maturation protein NosD [Paramagnetospirillum magnetotacticum]KIM00080.1 Nitrous oxide reductase maturation protein NosD [Paramagnetospirillum magnetotacticum MS-1]
MGMLIKTFSKSRLGALVVVFATGLSSAGATPQGVAEEPLLDSSLLQALIDIAQPGQVISPPPGRYKSHLVVSKPIVLDGRNQVTLDGEGRGSVLWVKTSGATIRNLRFTNSGPNHSEQDAGIQVRGNDNVIEDNRMDDVLFGFSLEQSERNTVRRNVVEGKKVSLGRRGDGIKLWYSHHNLIEANQFINGRDIVFWYSTHNRFVGNRQSGGRYGLHLMQAQYNIAENNYFFDNSTGISMMYDTGDELRNNVIAKAVGAQGVCISLKESSDVVIENNDILYCSQGISIDVAPYEPDSKNTIRANRIAYNDIGVAFLNDWKDNAFTGNLFSGNITEVAVYGGGSAKRNVWDGNRWEDYQGFDRDGDGVGDTPHRLFNYAGRVWMDKPNTRFFKGTPLLEVLDFLDRLAPFSEPVLMLEDKHPLVASDAKVRAGSTLDATEELGRNADRPKPAGETPQAHDKAGGRGTFGSSNHD